MKPMSSRFLIATVGLLGALTWTLGSCSSSSAEDGGGPNVDTGLCNTPACLPTSPDAGPDRVVGDVASPDVAEPSGEPPLLALCGDGCGVDASGKPLYPGNPDACNDTAGLAAGGAGGASAWGCGVTRGEDGAAVSACLPAGSAASLACQAASDCAPGYACVGQNNAAKCLPYCCTDPEACAEGTFCSVQPLHQPSDVPDDPLLVPVCIAAHDCWLDEPYPCPEEDSCTCPEGLACTVVRADGTTGCVPPGGGVEGEPCPCAPASENSLGYVCSQATETCVKVCSLGTSTSGCGVGSRCQATAALQDRFGVCTSSYSPDAG